MKKKLLTIVAILLLFTQLTLAEAPIRYCELVFTTTWSQQYFVSVAYSDQPAIPPLPVRDSSGRKIKFLSKMAALNYFEKDGWQLFNVFKEDGTHFILKK